MPRYRFQWENVPPMLMTQLAAVDDPPATDPVATFHDFYGARPDEDLVRDCWDIMREDWLAADADARERVVQQLWDLDLGEGHELPTRQADQLDYLRSCRNAKRLREVVLGEFLATGDASAAERGQGKPSAPAPAGGPSPATAAVTVSAPPARIAVSAPAGAVGFGDKVSFIWKIADLLRGNFRPHEYGQVMLPTLVLFRLDAVLAATKRDVLAAAAKLNGTGAGNDRLLRRAAKQSFYNTSPLTLATVLNDDKNVATQLKQYVNAFSPGVQGMLEQYNYVDKIARLDRAKILYQLLSHFADIELHPDVVSNEAMGYIFEELLRRFSEASKETAGEHYTPREVIHLMVDLLFAEDDKALSGEHPVRKIYDPAAGTGGMLIVAANRMRERNSTAQPALYGQELNPETWAIGRSDLMMQGEQNDAERLELGNSLTEDKHARESFDYLLANPPYGVDWKGYADPIRTEAAQSGFGGRFGAGLPRISDGSFLFLQHMISKMKPVADRPETRRIDGGSRIAIVLSGSPLFAGGAGSGESEIRRWIIENDWLEGIVALPDQIFYNTGISTYVWIVTNRKPAVRQGTVTLVDARELGTKMRKSLGDKRKELTPSAIDEISRLFADAPEIVASAEPDKRVKVLGKPTSGSRG